MRVKNCRSFTYMFSKKTAYAVGICIRRTCPLKLAACSRWERSWPFLPCSRYHRLLFWLSLQLKNLDGGPPAKRTRRSSTGVKEWHRLHGDAKKSYSAWQGGDLEKQKGRLSPGEESNHERTCFTIQKRSFLSQQKFKAEQLVSSVGWALCGLSDPSGRAAHSTWCAVWT